MGGSSSKNIADGMASVMTNVSNQTHVYQDQVTTAVNKISGCTQAEKTIIEQNAKALQRNTQLVDAKTDTNVQSDIQQQMLQEAMSKVGSLGIGYASASNVVSMYANAATVITNSLSAVTTQSGTAINIVDLGGDCSNKNVAGSLIIKQNAVASAISDQVVENTNVDAVAARISQELKQSASSTVESLAGFMVALALVIYAVGASFGSAIAPIVPVLIIGVLVVLIASAVVQEWPPFFSEPTYVSDHFRPETTDEVDNFSIRTLPLTETPLRYMFNIYDEPSKNGTKGTLLGLVVNTAVTELDSVYNSGYNASTMSALEKEHDKIKDFIKKCSKSDEIIKQLDTIPQILIKPNHRDYRIPLDYIASEGGGRCIPNVLRYTEHEDIHAHDCKHPRSLEAFATGETPDDDAEVYAMLNPAWKAFADGPQSELGRFFLCLWLYNPMNILDRNFSLPMDLNVYSSANDADALVMYRITDTEYGIDFARNLDASDKTVYEITMDKQRRVTGRFGSVRDSAERMRRTFQSAPGIVLTVVAAIILIFVARRVHVTKGARTQ